MLHSNQYNRVWLVWWLPLLTLVAGCGFSPLPMSVAAMPGPTTAPVDSPPATVEQIEGKDSIAASPSELSSEVTSSDAAVASTDVTVPDAQPSTTAFDSKQLVGCWRDGFCGQRTLTLKADGSATMLLELDFAGRLLYGKTLEFDMCWSLNDSILSFEISAGRPVDAARSAIKLWGEAFEYRLELVDNERLHGWTSGDTTLYKLRRVESPEANGDGQ
ncbi:MAG: hypothetical protein AABP62_02380 [Planctomycetota bacterium]